MTRRVQIPRRQLRDDDHPVTDTPGDPDTLIEVDRTAPPPSQPVPANAPDAQAAALALLHALAAHATTPPSPATQAIADAAQRLTTATGGPPSDPAPSPPGGPPVAPDPGTTGPDRSRRPRR